MVHELYAILALVCAMVIGILGARTITVRYSTVHKKSFIVLFSISILFCLIDMFWGICASFLFFKNRFLLVLSSYLFHISASFTTFFWFRFNLRFLDNKYSKNLILRVFSDLFLAFCVGIIISNFFTGNVFYIDERCVYYTNSLRNVLFFLQYSFFIVMLFVCIVSKISEQNEEKKSFYIISITYSISSLIAGFFQCLNADLPSYSLGFMFSCLLIYIFVITAENERLMLAQQKAESAMEY